jgi:hypothetical protein
LCTSFNFGCLFAYNDKKVCRCLCAFSCAVLESGAGSNTDMFHWIAQVEEKMRVIHMIEKEMV